MGKKMPATIINLDGVSVFPRWYTVTTKYNYEQKLGETIMNGAEKAGYADKIFEVLVPIKTIIETKINAKGQKVEREKNEKIYPGYIFVKVKMDEYIWNYIKNSEGSTTILAPSGIPIPIEEHEIIKIKEQCGLIEPEYDENFEPAIGQDVYVRGGVFQGQYGKITKIQENGITVDINGVPVKLKAEILEHVIFED